MRLAAGALLAVVVCVLIALLYVGQALQLLPSNDALARSVRQQTGQLRALPHRVLAPIDELSSESWCGEVHFLFRTPDGEPIRGYAHMKSTDVGEADRREWAVGADGRMTVPNARCRPAYSVRFSRTWKGGTTYEVAVQPGQDTYIIEVGPPSEREERVLRWREVCPMRVVLEEGDGSPVTGRVRLAHVGERDAWTALDPSGGVDFEEARCDRRPTVWLQPLSGGKSTPVSIVREPDDAPVVVVNLGLTARIRVVDPDGEPVAEAGVQSQGTQVEALSSGDFELTGSQEEVSVTISLSGKDESTHDVPLDGELHELVVDLPRLVDVHLQCDQCAGSFFCGQHLCEGTAPDLQCLCPNVPTELGMKTPDALSERRHLYDLLAVVPPDVDQLAVDIVGERGSVELRVTARPDVRIGHMFIYRPHDGDQPDQYHRIQHNPTAHGLGFSGQSRMVGELLPGPWTLSWEQSTYVTGEGWQAAYRSLDFELQGGEALDLGVIGH